MDQRNRDSETLAEIWGDFIDWGKRVEGLDSEFLITQLRDQTREQILDASLGDGIDSIHLLKRGFRVTSNEIDEAYIRKTKTNARQHGVTLDLTQHNWLEFDEHFLPETFGGIICLGNSITYLFQREEQLKALRNFHKSLKPGGRLIIDERNYQYFLDCREEILAGNFRYSGDYVYHGQKVHAHPIEISDDLVVMEYEHTQTKQKGYLHLYLFKRGELMSLLREAGFSDVVQYSDYEAGYNPEADFHQYVCTK